MRFAFLLAPFLLLAGCVSEPVAPAARADLLMARAGDDVQLEWDSQKNLLYTITYSDVMGAGAHWQPLPQATRLRGTGGRMSLTDHVVGGRARYYSIVIEPPGGTAAAPQRSRATKTPNSGR